MKKLLLFALAFGLGTMTYAQSINATHSVKATDNMNTLADKELSSAPIKKKEQTKNVAANNILLRKTGNKSISETWLTSSGNVYGYLVEQCTPLTINEDIDIISFTHRANPAFNYASSTGDIINSQSRDNGATWTQMAIFPDSNGYHNRYPGGVIFNPAGNTIADSAFLISFGPSHDGVSANVWQHAFMGSLKFDSTSIKHQYMPTYGSIPRMGLQATSDSTFHSIATNTSGDGQNSAYNFDTIKVVTGVWNSTTRSVDWSQTKFQENFVMYKGVSDAFANAAIYSAFNTAWSSDGTIGYFWSVGRDLTTDLRSYQPIVWKTTDGGTTWTKMPIFDFGTIATITKYLQPMKGVSPKTSRPSFNGSNDGVVDANGDLHIIARVAAASSNNNDSLNYSYYYANNTLSNPIFDIFTTSTGWDAVHLGDVVSFSVNKNDGGFGTGQGAIGWDMRLQAGITADGTKIFASWTDSDTSLHLTNPAGYFHNLTPNIIAVGYDIITKKQTTPINFTLGTSMDGACYFHYMSDIISNNNGVYEIPLTRLNLNLGQQTPADSVSVFYIHGISFSDADFITNPGFASTINNIATVSQNRPNPFNGNTNIDVRLTQASDVVIEVMNITGQKVMVLNNGRLSAGNHTFQINGSNLSAGVYFYTVHAGNSSVTKKMIVQ